MHRRTCAVDKWIDWRVLWINESTDLCCGQVDLRPYVVDKWIDRLVLWTSGSTDMRCGKVARCTASSKLSVPSMERNVATVSFAFPSSEAIFNNTVNCKTTKHWWLVRSIGGKTSIGENRSAARRMPCPSVALPIRATAMNPGMAFWNIDHQSGWRCTALRAPSKSRR
jgi:hypothetical protein